MKSIITNLSLAVVAAFAAVSVVAVPAYAAGECEVDNKVSVTEGVNCAKSDDQKSNFGVVVKDITNVLLFIIGAVSVIMIIIGGLKYVLSNGDSAQLTSAKNTILYAVIGLIVALLAYAIVNFVLDSFLAGNNNNGGGQSRTR